MASNWRVDRLTDDGIVPTFHPTEWAANSWMYLLNTVKKNRGRMIVWYDAANYER